MLSTFDSTGRSIWDSPISEFLRPAMAGTLALIPFSTVQTPWPKRAETASRPTIVWIGDDPFMGNALGPDAWACARAAKYWCKAVVVHGAAGTHDHYREALRGAEIAGRVVFVETSRAMLPRWARFLNCPNTLLILPKDGSPHPIRPAAEHMQ